MARAVFDWHLKTKELAHSKLLEQVLEHAAVSKATVATLHSIERRERKRAKEAAFSQQTRIGTLESELVQEKQRGSSQDLCSWMDQIVFSFHQQTLYAIIRLLCQWRADAATTTSHIATKVPPLNMSKLQDPKRVHGTPRSPKIVLQTPRSERKLFGFAAEAQCGEVLTRLRATAVSDICSIVLRDQVTQRVTRLLHNWLQCFHIDYLAARQKSLDAALDSLTKAQQEMQFLEAVIAGEALLATAIRDGNSDTIDAAEVALQEAQSELDASHCVRMSEEAKQLKEQISSATKARVIAGAAGDQAAIAAADQMLESLKIKLIAVQQQAPHQQVRLSEQAVAGAKESLDAVVASANLKLLAPAQESLVSARLQLQTAQHARFATTEYAVAVAANQHDKAQQCIESLQSTGNKAEQSLLEEILLSPLDSVLSESVSPIRADSPMRWSGILAGVGGSVITRALMTWRVAAVRALCEKNSNAIHEEWKLQLLGEVNQSASRDQLYLESHAEMMRSMERKSAIKMLNFVIVQLSWGQALRLFGSWRFGAFESDRLEALVDVGVRWSEVQSYEQNSSDSEQSDSSSDQHSEDETWVIS